MIEQLRELGEVEGINDFEALRAFLKRQSAALDSIVTRLHADTLANSTLIRPGELLWTIASRDGAKDESRPGFIRFSRERLRLRKADYPDLFAAIGNEDSDDTDWFLLPDLGNRVPLVSGEADNPPGATPVAGVAGSSTGYDTMAYDVWIKT